MVWFGPGGPEGSMMTGEGGFAAATGPNLPGYVAPTPAPPPPPPPPPPVQPDPQPVQQYHYQPVPLPIVYAPDPAQTEPDGAVRTPSGVAAPGLQKGSLARFFSARILGIPWLLLAAGVGFYFWQRSRA